MNKKDIPNPGTQEAIDACCTCPVWDDEDGNLKFWMRADCPLHGYIDPENKEVEE